MSYINRKLIEHSLKKLEFKIENKTINAADIITSLNAKNGHIQFIIEESNLHKLGVSKDFPINELENIAQQCQKYLLKNTSSTDIQYITTSNKTTPAPKDTTNNENVTQIINKESDRKKISGTKRNIQNVKKIIAIASGKGGVGKSTTAINTAIALSQKGYQVGIVDADIYGPSIVRMIQPRASNSSQSAKNSADNNDNIAKDNSIPKPNIENDMMIPPISHNVKYMSMALLVDENQATIWRAPMVVKALHQLMLKTNWGDLDYLIIDMPPGTGDVQLTLAQNYEIDGAIIVTTPQNIALDDVVKSINAFKKTNINIIGMVENMSYHIDRNNTDKSTNKNYIFGKGNVEKICEDMNINKICEIEISPEITKNCDNGQPSTLTKDSLISKTYHIIADRIINSTIKTVEKPTQ